MLLLWVLVVLEAHREVRHLGMIRHLAQVLLLHRLVVVEVVLVTLGKIPRVEVLAVVNLVKVARPLVLVIHHLPAHLKAVVVARL